MTRPAIPKYIENHVFRRDEGACRYCDRDPETHPKLSFHIHHIDIWRDVQKHDPTRMVVACEECNHSIGTQIVEPLYRPRSERRRNVVTLVPPPPEPHGPSLPAWAGQHCFKWRCECSGSRLREPDLKFCGLCEAERPWLTGVNLNSGKIVHEHGYQRTREYRVPFTPPGRIEVEYNPFDQSRMEV